MKKIEDIGALRFLEYGISIHYDIEESKSLSVDTPKDLEQLRRILAKNAGVQHRNLNVVLSVPVLHKGGVAA